MEVRVKRRWCFFRADFCDTLRPYFVTHLEGECDILRPHFVTYLEAKCNTPIYIEYNLCSVTSFATYNIQNTQTKRRSAPPLRAGVRFWKPITTISLIAPTGRPFLQYSLSRREVKARPFRVEAWTSRRNYIKIPRPTFRFSRFIALHFTKLRAKMPYNGWRLDIGKYAPTRLASWSEEML